jgi:hypothetical protein
MVRRRRISVQARRIENQTPNGISPHYRAGEGVWYAGSTFYRLLTSEVARGQLARESATTEPGATWTGNLA